jgi:hypothetical protein
MTAPDGAPEPTSSRPNTSTAEACCPTVRKVPLTGLYATLRLSVPPITLEIGPSVTQLPLAPNRAKLAPRPAGLAQTNTKSPFAGFTSMSVLNVADEKPKVLIGPRAPACETVRNLTNAEVALKPEDPNPNSLVTGFQATLGSRAVLSLANGMMLPVGAPAVLIKRALMPKAAVCQMTRNCWLTGE